MRWHQLSFMAVFSTRQFQPFSAVPYSEEALQAFSGGLARTQFAETTRPVDLEDFEDFADEWIERFTMAARGHLRHPGHLPLAPRRGR